jgi:hypothetical protein
MQLSLSPAEILLYNRDISVKNKPFLHLHELFLTFLKGLNISKHKLHKIPIFPL